MSGKEAPYRRFLRGYTPDLETGCWNWLGVTGANGYGQIKVFGKMVSVHRFSFELHHGPIGEGMEILHSCDNKKCVNPDHIKQGTHKENMGEAADRGRMPHGKDHHMFGRSNPRPKQANSVIVLGKRYPSQKSAERALGLGSGTVRYWIKNSPEKARVVSKGI